MTDHAPTVIDDVRGLIVASRNAQSWDESPEPNPERLAIWEGREQAFAQSLTIRLTRPTEDAVHNILNRYITHLHDVDELTDAVMRLVRGESDAE